MNLSLKRNLLTFFDSFKQSSLKLRLIKSTKNLLVRKLNFQHQLEKTWLELNELFIKHRFLFHQH